METLTALISSVLIAWSEREHRILSFFLLRLPSPDRRLPAKHSSFFPRELFVLKIIIRIDLPANDKISASIFNFADAYYFYAVTDARRNTWENTVNIWTRATRDHAVRTVVRAGWRKVAGVAHLRLPVPVLSDLPRACARYRSRTRATHLRVWTVPLAIWNRSVNTFAPVPLDTPVSISWQFHSQNRPKQKKRKRGASRRNERFLSRKRVVRVIRLVLQSRYFFQQLYKVGFVHLSWHNYNVETLNATYKTIYGNQV